MIPKVVIPASSKKVLKKMQYNVRSVKIGAKKGLTYAGKFFLKIASDKIKDKSNKTGRFYLYKGKRIQASAAGEYYANRSGHARRNL